MLSLKFRQNLIFINMKLNFHRKKTLPNLIEELSNQENGRAYLEDYKLLKEENGLGRKVVHNGADSGKK